MALMSQYTRYVFVATSHGSRTPMARRSDSLTIPSCWASISILRSTSRLSVYRYTADLREDGNETATEQGEKSIGPSSQVHLAMEWWTSRDRSQPGYLTQARGRELLVPSAMLRCNYISRYMWLSWIIPSFTVRSSVHIDEAKLWGNMGLRCWIGRSAAC